MPARRHALMSTVTALGFGVALTAGPRPASAQGWLDRAKQRAQEKIKQRADQKTDQAVDKTLDKAEATVTGGGTAAPGAGTRAAAGAANGTGATAAGGGPSFSGGEAFVNYDFTPGETPLFVEDFARDNVGDFPRRLTFRAGNAEVATWNGARWLRFTSPSAFEIPLRGPLPQRFTVEMDVALPPNDNGIPQGRLELYPGDDTGNPGLPVEAVRQTMLGAGYRVATVDNVEGYVFGGGVQAQSVARTAYPNGRPVALRVMVDGNYVKLYVGGERTANVPNATFRRANRILLRAWANETHPGYVGNIRVMAGGRKLYDALAESGRVATQGVLFATGSDQIRPESKPTLDEMGAMLAEHADLRLTIEGHTDNAGDAAANQALSERRAQAVRQALVSRYGVDGARLTARGFGASKPAASNATAEGRQQNRRVELVRM